MYLLCCTVEGLKRGHAKLRSSGCALSTLLGAIAGLKLFVRCFIVRPFDETGAEGFETSNGHHQG